MAGAFNSNGIAFDRASVRTKDANGHLHVALSNISKATVNPYFGKEIPGGQALGLQPDAVYYLLRDPAELAKAVDTFNNLPILSQHVPMSAERPATEFVIGSTGTDAVFNDPYLQNSTVIWDQDDIDDIETETKREWSCSYWFRVEMTAGSFRGLRFDGIMRDIRGNHLALVEDGRAGADCIVGDQAMAISARNMKRLARKASGQVKLAMDAGLDVGDVERLIAAINGSAPAAAAEDDDLNDAGRNDDDDDDDDDDAKAAALAKDDEAKPEAKPASIADDEGDDGDDDDKKDKPAMDANAIRAAARADARREMAAVRKAERAVAPHVGELAMDSAPTPAAIYCLALDSAKVDYPKGQSADVYAAMVAMLPVPGGKEPVVAMDSAARAGAHKSFADRFGASHLIAS